MFWGAVCGFDFVVLRARVICSRRFYVWIYSISHHNTNNNTTPPNPQTPPQKQPRGRLRPRTDDGGARRVRQRLGVAGGPLLAAARYVCCLVCWVLDIGGGCLKACTCVCCPTVGRSIHSPPHPHTRTGFTTHAHYEDFSLPCFDGQHHLIMGGSFASTGAYYTYLCTCIVGGGCDTSCIPTLRHVHDTDAHPSSPSTLPNITNQTKQKKNRRRGLPLRALPLPPPLPPARRLPDRAPQPRGKPFGLHFVRFFDF